MNIYNIHNFVLPKQRRPSYLYNVSMYFPNPKRVVDENNSSSFSFLPHIINDMKMTMQNILIKMNMVHMFRNILILLIIRNILNKKYH